MHGDPEEAEPLLRQALEIRKERGAGGTASPTGSPPTSAASPACSGRAATSMGRSRCSARRWRSAGTSWGRATPSRSSASTASSNCCARRRTGRGSSGFRGGTASQHPYRLRLRVRLRFRAAATIPVAPVVSPCPRGPRARDPAGRRARQSPLPRRPPHHRRPPSHRRPPPRSDSRGRTCSPGGSRSPGPEPEVALLLLPRRFLSPHLLVPFSPPAAPPAAPRPAPPAKETREVASAPKGGARQSPPPPVARTEARPADVSAGQPGFGFPATRLETAFGGVLPGRVAALPARRNAGKRAGFPLGVS